MTATVHGTNLDRAPVSEQMNFSSSKERSSEKMDFRKLLLNSQEATVEKKKEDLASSLSYEDFLSRLQTSRQEAELPRHELNKQDFLKLFVTQLKNQDPLEPQNGSEMAAQMAHFSSLEHMLNIHTQLESLHRLLEGQKIHSLAPYVGQEAKVENAVLWDPQKPMKALIELKEDYGNLDLEISSPEGEIFGRLPMGLGKAGVHQVHWDGGDGRGGNVAPGVYHLSVVAKRDINGEEELRFPVKSYVPIEGLDIHNPEKPFLTPIGSLSLDQLKEIRERPEKIQNFESKEVLPLSDEEKSLRNPLV